MDSIKYKDILEANVQRSIQTSKLEERLAIPARQ